ncbi:hypothetical protein MVEN_01914500 [Mycena venus]|uniref:Uncharacterized protein n=1 Tax=Mycena venus TaxID=2733690 RepID=A0A8H6XF29_9AGAR|nr:hypothetical protein MVEN_01914500 [Mycena venus]
MASRPRPRIPATFPTGMRLHPPFGSPTPCPWPLLQRRASSAPDKAPSTLKRKRVVSADVAQAGPIQYSQIVPSTSSAHGTKAGDNEPPRKVLILDTALQKGTPASKPTDKGRKKEPRLGQRLRDEKAVVKSKGKTRASSIDNRGAAKGKSKARPSEMIDQGKKPLAKSVNGKGQAHASPNTDEDDNAQADGLRVITRRVVSIVLRTSSKPPSTQKTQNAELPGTRWLSRTPRPQ